MATDTPRVTVNVTDTCTATAVVRTTSSGNTLEIFPGLVYATRARSFELPLPVEYAGRQAANALDRLYIAPPMGAGLTEQAPPCAVGGLRYAYDDAACCQLDVYRPLGGTYTRPLRVVVFVHGGFLELSNRANPLDGLCDEALRALPGSSFDAETLFVTVEYSLGAYGWWYEDGLAGPDAGAEHALHAAYGRHAGNIALHQVIQTLLWVQRHIAAFGGDAGDVTLLGHSAGAALAHWAFLALTPQTLATYGFAAPPVHKLLLMGGSAPMFPAIDAHTAGERQDLVLDTLCLRYRLRTAERMRILLPRGASGLEAYRAACVERMCALVAVGDGPLRKACLDACASWAPVVDGVLVTPQHAAYVRGQGSVPLDFSRNVRVFLTTMEHEASILCKPSERAIDDDALVLWRKVASACTVQRISELEPETLRDFPWLHAVRTSSAYCFHRAMLQSYASFAAAGVESVQAAVLDTHVDGPMGRVAQHLTVCLLKERALGLDRQTVVDGTAAIVAGAVPGAVALAIMAFPPAGALAAGVLWAGLMFGCAAASWGAALGMRHITRLASTTGQRSVAEALEQHLVHMGAFHGLEIGTFLNSRMYRGRDCVTMAEAFRGRTLARLSSLYRGFIEMGKADLSLASAKSGHCSDDGVAMRADLRALAEDSVWDTIPYEAALALRMGIDRESFFRDVVAEIEWYHDQRVRNGGVVQLRRPIV